MGLVWSQLPRQHNSKESSCQCRRRRDLGSIPGLGRCHGGGHGNPLRYPYLDGSAGKESTHNAGELGLIPGLGRSPEGKSDLLKYSGLENSMDYTVYGGGGCLNKSDTTEWLSLSPGEFHGWRSLAGYSPWGCKELDITELLSVHTQAWCQESFKPDSEANKARRLN